MNWIIRDVQTGLENHDIQWNFKRGDKVRLNATVLDKLGVPIAAGKVVVTLKAPGGASETVELFDAIQREPIGMVEVGSGTERGTFSPDGTTLAVVTSHGDLVSIDVATRTVVARVAAEGSVDALAYAPDGARLLTAESEPRSELLIPRDPHTLEPSGAAVPTNGGEPQVAPLSSFAMAFSPEGTLVTTRLSGPGKLTTEWNADLKPIRSFTFGGNAVAMSPNGRTAALRRLAASVTDAYGHAVIASASMRRPFRS